MILNVLNEKQKNVLKAIIQQEGYLLLTFEGPTCCGKTTQAQLMASFLRENLDEDVIYLPNPIKFSSCTEATIDLMMNTDPQISALGALANRVCLQSSIFDFAKSGKYKVFVTDRWNLSFWVHQLDISNLKKDEPSFSYWCSMFPDKVSPQFQFYLEVDKNILESRLAESSKQLNKFEKTEFIDRVRESYRNISRVNAAYNIININNESIEDTQSNIQQALIKRINYFVS